PTLILSGVLWLPIYFLPGELAFAGLLKLGGANQAHPPNWQISAIGLAGSFFFGRRIAKGIAYHLQRIFIKERLENRKYSPAWWMVWPVRSRFRWEETSWDRSRVNRLWRHHRIQRVVHMAPMLLLIAAVIFTTVQGFVI